MAEIAPPDSQTAPLPDPGTLPFKLVSKTIGQGAYASIRKAVPKHQTSPIIAIKFVNKQHAFKQGRVTEKQLKTEITLHKYLGKHQNIIQFLTSGDDSSWMWIAMELADGGDLFDKIEPDLGCGEDIAHFYFVQLINAVSYMHSKGVAHRDLKPENFLLSANGELKVADFGLAALFEKDGRTRMCNTICGSAPYMAPEIVDGRRSRRHDILDVGYAPNISDVWACGVILFVLLAGNTPWDSPTAQSEEFKEYVAANGRLPDDELWHKIPTDILSLLYGILSLDPETRFTIQDIKSHPWFRRSNRYLSPAGRSANPIGLATDMLAQLRIDFRQAPILSQSQNSDAMDIDSSPRRSRSGSSENNDTTLIPSTEHETPIAETPFNWERPLLPASQSWSAYSQSQMAPSTQEMLSQDPSLSQFSQNQLSPDDLMTLSQAARAFRDIMPSYSLARFLSPLSINVLVPMIVETLWRLSVPSPSVSHEQVAQWAREGKASIRVKMSDGRRQGLNGHVLVERISLWENPMSEVRFVKASGDPLEWRRFFKNVVICIGEKGIVRPDS